MGLARRGGVWCLAALFPLAAAAEPGDWLVKLRGPLDTAALARLEAASGGRVVEVLPQIGVVRLTPPPPGSAAAARRGITLDADVESVEEDALGRGGGFVPFDPSFPSQWHLDNIGQTGGTPDADIDAPEGWEITRGHARVVVAVLDTGIDSDHPEFAGRILPSFDFVNEDPNPEADHPHGVQVTGLLAANSDNGIDAAGVDHFARLLPVKVLKADNTGFTSDLVAGLLWAADQGADVISMSLAEYPRNSQTIESALQYARDRGAVLVACAGNGGMGNADTSWPGGSAKVISVGWTDEYDQRAAFGSFESATGAALDLVAPGRNLVTVSSTAGILFSGCSAATPLVAGIASLLRGSDPTLSHDEILQILIDTAEDQVGPPAEDTPGRDDYFGYGRVNLARAVATVPESASPLAAGAALAGLAARRRRARAGPSS